MNSTSSVMEILLSLRVTGNIIIPFTPTNYPLKASNLTPPEVMFESPRLRDLKQS